MTDPNTQPEFRIDRARLADLDDVAMLFDDYRRFYAQSSQLAEAREFLRERMEGNESVIFLARLHDAAVGFTQLYPAFSSVSMRRIWILNDLFVAPRARRMKIGSALLDLAVKFAAETGAVRLELATAHDNHTARAPYEQSGWLQNADFVHYVRSVNNITPQT